MATRYVSTKTAYLYRNAAGSSRSMVLIYGDRVQTDGTPDPDSSDRIAVTFRGRAGFLRQDQLGTTRPLELYFLDVGQGDATFIVTPAGRKILVDGGLGRQALGFLVWFYRLDDPANVVDVDLLVVSHADGDHLDGLVPIVTHPQIRVQRVVHNGIALYRDGVHETRVGDRDAGGEHLLTWHDRLSDLSAADLAPGFRTWRQALLDEQCAYGAVDAATVPVLDVGDPAVTLEVLGPRYVTLPGGAAALPWFDGGGSAHAHTINGHSVVLRLRFGDVSLLLSGDLNIEGSEHLMRHPDLVARLSAQVLKSPHHGSHEFHPPLFDAVRPQVTVVSSGDGPDHGHPRANFLAAVGRASRSSEPLLFSTEIAATFVEAGDELAPGDPERLEDLDFSLSAANVYARKLFKQRLPGLINVRTDGRDLYAARRVNQGYWWESYGPLPAAAHPTVFG